METTHGQGHGWSLGLGAAALAGLALCACDGGGGGSGGTGGTTTSGPARPFLMGSTPFFMTSTSLPDWRFEDMDDKDLLSLHVDDFWGVPWEELQKPAPSPPAAWTS